jgi:hypothetical protein
MVENRMARSTAAEQKGHAPMLVVDRSRIVSVATEMPLLPRGTDAPVIS